MSKKFPITLAGFKNLEEELHELKTVKRPQISVKIAEAREHGDLKENAEYHAAREEQSHLETRVGDLENKLAGADVIDVSKLSGKTVLFGATVNLLDDDSEKEVKYRIVGEYEADLTKNFISIQSPLAKALIGKSINDDVEVITPRGTKTYEVINVEFIP